MMRARIWMGFALTLAIAGACGWLYAVNWSPPRADYAVQGIDVSADDGKVDWPTIRAMDVDFAYARATIGVDSRDATFAQHWAGMSDAGVRRGAIHVYSLCRRATEQAASFVATVPRDPDALPAAIDLDFPDDCPARPERGVVLGELRQLASIIETHSGKPVIFRVTRQFEAQYGVSGAIPRPVWSVGLFFPPDYAARPWRLWQSSTIRRIEGVERAVNWNVLAP